MKFQHQHSVRGLMVALPLLVIAGAALAAGSKVVPQLSVFKVAQTPAGQETFSPATTIKPGEVIEYRLRYSNEGADGVRNVQGTLPIPAGLELIQGTMSPVPASASTDGKTFSALPLKHLEKAADGTEKWVAIPYSQYRFVRWAMPVLPAGQSTTVSARARIAPPVISKPASVASNASAPVTR